MIDEEGIDELIGKLTPVGPEEALDTSDLPGFLDENLIYFLSKCNAGYSQDNYFHFFGTSGNEGHDLKTWNSMGLWKKEYGELVEGYYFFAEDIFGNQFGQKIGSQSNEIFMFWVDDGRIKAFANDFLEFIEFTIFDFDIFAKMRKLCVEFLLSSPRAFTPFHHLSYRKPILLGGDSGDTNNLEIIDSIANLKFLGQLVTQTRALPKGTRIIDVIIDKEAQSIRLVPE